MGTIDEGYIEDRAPHLWVEKSNIKNRSAAKQSKTQTPQKPLNQMAKEQNEIYNQNLRKFREIDNDYDYLDDIKEMFQTKKIKVIKYNNTLDPEASKCFKYNAFLEMCEDGDEIIITNKVKCLKEEYILEHDPLIIQNKIKEKTRLEKKFL